MWASLADDFVREDTAESIFDQVWIFGTFQRILQTIKQNAWEFVDIHLFIHICWITFIIFERHTERFGIVGLSIAEHQVHEHFLNLIKDIIIDCYWVIGRILRDKQGPFELFNHEDLLEETVHVTDASQIPEPCIACGWLESITVSYGPVFEFSGSPKTVYM